MNILLFSLPRRSPRIEAIRRIFDALDRHALPYAVNEEFAREVKRLLGLDIAPERIYGARIPAACDPQSVMVCYGGDGTLLEGAHRLHGAPLPIVGINSGHLGFLASAATDDIDTLFDDLASGRIRTEPRTLLDVSGDFDQTPDSTLALNEFSVQRHGAEMISVETYVDGQMVATYHGDGVVVCTPTGSTAYSLSAGGPVVAPQCGCLVISPLAPHNLTMRPVVIPDTAEVRLNIRTRHTSGFVTLDNRIYPIGNGASFTVRRAEERIYLAVAHNISFYDTLRNKMMWGVDIRS